MLPLTNCSEFLSTPSARRATQRRAAHVQVCLPISIHALREEGDRLPTKTTPKSLHFYPRPPRGGRRIWSNLKVTVKIFLSTPSARRATRWVQFALNRSVNFYPRPPRGGRLSVLWLSSNQSENFYPRPPRGGRHRGISAFQRTSSISIHALREEGDARWDLDPRLQDYFYPRPPRGGRPQARKEKK